MTKFEEELMATAKMIPTSDGNEIKFKTSSALYDYLLLSNGEAELYLESQLQQQALPVVPECVDYEIKYRRNNSYSGIEPSDGLLLMQVFQDLNCNGRMHRSGEEGYWQDGEFYKWMQSSQNFPIFFKAVTEGYTVEKPQMFYLKNKLTDDFLYMNSGKFSECEKNSMSWRLFKTKFTQEDINSLDTGSYEQIEVEK